MSTELDQAVKQLGFQIALMGTALGRGGYASLLTHNLERLIDAAQQVRNLAIQEPDATFASTLESPDPFLPILGEIATGRVTIPDEVMIAEILADMRREEGGDDQPR